jgi:hypothetical protein
VGATGDCGGGLSDDCATGDNCVTLSGKYCAINGGGIG